jgi:hypothetical protein
MKPKKTVLAQEFIVFDVCTHASSKISDECVTQYKSAREITTISDPLLLELRHPDRRTSLYGSTILPVIHLQRFAKLPCHITCSE